METGRQERTDPTKNKLKADAIPLLFFRCNLKGRFVRHGIDKDLTGSHGKIHKDLPSDTEQLSPCEVGVDPVIDESGRGHMERKPQNEPIANL